MTTTETRKSQNERSNEQNNSSACAFRNCVRFLAVVWKITTWKHQNLDGTRKKTPTPNYLSFNMELNAAPIPYAKVNFEHHKKWLAHSVIREIPTENIYSFLNRLLPWR